MNGGKEEAYSYEHITLNLGNIAFLIVHIADKKDQLVTDNGHEELRVKD